MTTLFRPRARTEQSFYRSLMNVMDLLERIGYNGAAPLDLTARLRHLVTAPFWVHYAEEAARSMVTMLFVDGARDWREAARMSGRGRDIYDALRAELLGPVGSAFYGEVGRNAELIRTLPLSVANRVTAYIADETAKGRRPEAIAEEIAAMFPKATQASAQLIARTEVAKTQGALTRARAENIGIPAYVWRTSEDQRVRDSHRHMDGVIVFWSEPPSPEKLLGKKNPPAPYHAGGIYNCFPGSTQVSLANGYQRVWRRMYRGNLVGLLLSDGTTFEATPNHPVLTLNGWTPVNALKNGDYLVSAVHNADASPEDNESELIPTFEDLFGALGPLLGSHRSIGLPLDFHGDGIEDYVDVISINGRLPDNGIVPHLKDICDLTLAVPDSRVYESVIRGGLSHIGESLFTSSSNERPACFRVELGHSDEHGGRAVARGDSISKQNAAYHGTTAVPFERKRELALAGQIVTHNLSFGNIDSAIGRRAATDRYHEALGAEVLADKIRRMANDLGGLSEGDSFGYKLLRVLDLRSRNWSGHVYNLQSNNGWYSITPARIAVKNCRCISLPLVRLTDVEWPHRCYHAGKIRMMRRAEFERLLAPGSRLAA